MKKMKQKIENIAINKLDFGWNNQEFWNHFISNTQNQYPRNHSSL